jgi:hypothetical protein
MKGNPHPAPSGSASGGLIHLQARLTNPITWLIPGWAGLCGVVASAGFGWQGQDWLRLAVLILLLDGGWGTLWAALGGTNWAKPLRRWRNWRFGEPVASLPYTLPGSPGGRASRWLGQLGAWWRAILWPTCGPAISAIAVATPVTAVLGALLGWELLLLSAAALAVMQLSLAWEGGRGTITPEWDSIVAVMLPWLAGHVTFGSLTLRSAGLALAFTLAWSATWRAGSPRGRTLGIGAQLLAGAFLVLLYRPMAAGLLLLLLVPQMALLPWLQRGQPVSWYVRHIRPWLMAGMLVAAWAL